MSLITGSSTQSWFDPPLELSAAEVMERRVATAMLACVARFGLSKLTVDDVAREAGCGRATVYRYIGGKGAVEAVTMAAEVDRFGRLARTAAAESVDLEDALVEVVVAVALEVEQHAALQFLLEFEPELLLPQLAFEHGDRFLAHARLLLAPVFERFLSADAAERLAEYVIRILLSYLCSPDSVVSMTDETAVRGLVRAFVLPAFAGPAGNTAKGAFA